MGAVGFMGHKVKTLCRVSTPAFLGVTAQQCLWVLTNDTGTLPNLLMQA